MIGYKIRIIDKILPNYGEEYYIIFKTPNAFDLWSYAKDKGLGIADGCR